MSAEKVCKIINEGFGKPFMPADFVEAKIAFDLWNKPYINLRIGAKDYLVDFTNHSTSFVKSTKRCIIYIRW